MLTAPSRVEHPRRIDRWPVAAGICVVSGLLIAAALPPVGLWPLAFAGIALLDWALAGQGPRDRFWRGTLAAAAVLFPTLGWMSAFTVPGYMLAAAIMAAMFGAGYLAVPPGPGRWLALPAAVVLVEAVRGRWPFGGVPLSTLAHAEVAGPLASTARLGGPLLLIGLTVVGGVVLAALARRGWRAAAIGGAVLVAAVALAAVAPRGERVDEIDVALVQGGGPQGTQAVDTDDRVVFERHLAASEEVPEGTDLVVWPEDIVDIDGAVVDAPEAAEIADLARRLDATVVVGVVEGEGNRFRNAAIAVNPDGTIADRYEKVRRVPFGEYIPFRRLLAPFGPDELVPRDAIVGEDPAVLDTEVGPLGVAISWEVFFADRARDAIGNGGRVLLNPTNGSSYSGTAVQTQQVAASQLRAIETGRWTLQVAPTGFTAIIDDTGTVLDRTSISERAVLARPVDLREGQTIATRIGDWGALVLALLALAGGWWIERRVRPRAAPSPAPG
jgi:apolipoprotein N-acyltransferase